MHKKKLQPIIDSRHMKVLSVKKEDLKDSVVFICLDEEKYGHYDVSQLREMAERIDKLEPSGCYFIGLKTLRINVFDKAEIKNRDIVVTVSHAGSVDIEAVENGLRQAFEGAKSVNIVHHYAEVSE